MQLLYTNLNDEMLFITVFVLIDDYYSSLSFPQKDTCRSGPAPDLYDSEIMTLEIVRELKSVNSRSAWVSHIRNNWRHLFPKINERSRYQRRVNDLWQIFNLVRIHTLRLLGLQSPTYAIIDSMPLPVCHYARSHRARAFIEHADFGYCAAKDEKFFGFKIHTLVSIDGIPLSFVLAPASHHDSALIEEMLDPFSNLIVGGDKGYVGAAMQQHLAQSRNIRLIAMPKSNQAPLAQSDFWFLLRFRKSIETFFSLLSDKFSASVVKAKKLWGLSAQLFTKFAAFTIGAYISKTKNLCAN